MHPITYNACLAAGIVLLTAGAGLAFGAAAALASAGTLVLVCTFATAILLSKAA